MKCSISSKRKNFVNTIHYKLTIVEKDNFAEYDFNNEHN